MLERLLAAGTAAKPCASVAEWWPAHRAIARACESTIDQAIAGGFHADRTGWAFASGYQAALRALLQRFPKLELAGEPRWRPSLFLRGLASLPLAW